MKKNIVDDNKKDIKDNNIKNSQTQPKEEIKTKKKSKLRIIFVIAFLILFVLGTFIAIRGNYLEYKELGESYLEIFWTNFQYKYYVMGINFIALYIIIYLTNRGIQKGLKVFFEQEKIDMPKLPNKSIALIISAIVSAIIAIILTPKIILLNSGASFGITDSIFNLDISYYMFVKPVIEIFIIYFISLIVFLTAYMALYYIIVFNMYFDGIDRNTLKQSNMMKKLLRNVKLISIGIAMLILINTQNILFSKYITLENDVDLIGAGFTESTIKLWGYIIFAIVIIVAVWKGIKYFKQSDNKKLFICVASIPTYLVAFFVVIVLFDLIFVATNELDREKDYINTSIASTRSAYNINVEEVNLDYSGTITLEETQSNSNVINNVNIVSKEAVLNTLEDTQTETGYYSYRDATIGSYKINGKMQLVYLSPREIVSNSRTYNNKTYEYTHGMGEIITSATTTTETGAIEYIQNDITGDDNKINITQPRIYFGLETNDIIATNTTNKTEYDYTDESGEEYSYSYDGEAGLQLGFWDRLILGITKGDLNLAFSTSITSESKLLINRNIIERAQKALPDLIYDENPYTVIDSEGNIIWVLDAYTVSSEYPYSSYTTIEYDGSRERINYIRNSIKVLINSYDGTMKFYITDRTDPIAMAYRSVYSSLFEDIEEEIPSDISEHFIYPEFLYNIQSEMLTTFHNVKADVLYRSDDIWDFATYNSTQTTKSTGSKLEPYYTMVKTNDSSSETLGLIQMYTPADKQNIMSYLVGSYENGESSLKLYKFSADSSILGPIQLDSQIEQDETISSEIQALNVTGAKVTKEMIIVPINNTLLYVEPIYQTMINESDIPMLKKVVVASGNKVAIGDDLSEALNNLLSQDAVNINVENTEDIEGLIDAIIRANNNLTESNSSNNWEQMGIDIQRLQDLINSLEKLQEETENTVQEAEENQEQLESSSEENSVNETNATENESVDNTNSS